MNTRAEHPALRAEHYAFLDRTPRLDHLVFGPNSKQPGVFGPITLLGPNTSHLWALRDRTLTCWASMTEHLFIWVEEHTCWAASHRTLSPEHYTCA